MKAITQLFAVILFIPVFAIAQNGRDWHREDRRDDRSSLSVFSENGEQFLLIINGISQNTAPASRIRVEGLPQYTNDVEIIFADNRTPAIRKQVNISDPVDGRAVDMVLKIFRNREGYAKLRFVRSNEVEHNYRAQNGEYVMSYGQQTTTTTIYNNTPPPPPPPPAPMPMDATSFNEAKNTISNSSFDDSKLSTAKTILASNYLTTDQVIEICNLFSFDDRKLAFAKAAYGRTVDNNNYFKVGNVFSFDSYRNSLNEYVSKQH